jgi:ectoine hydroxylase-related dioxygenase (phytanoyl-CoA dioxygenase family)
VTSEERWHLDELGYVVLDGFMDAALLRDLRARILALFDEEGERAGSEFRTEPHARRLANLVDKGDVFRRAIVLPPLLAYVRHVLGPAIKLSSLNARSADPHNEAQPLHVDMAAIPDERGYWVCNTVWMLDDFTPDNGATRVVPGSHRWGTRPQDVLEDPLAAHPQEALVTGKAGSLAVMNAHLWHGGTANRTAAPRLAMHAFYCRRDKPQQLYQKKWIRPEVQASLPPELRDLLALDDPLNDEMSVDVPVRSGFMK